MSLRFPKLLSILFFCAACDARVLRVCADPNNLPFSNQANAGLENKLAQIIAKDLGASLQTTWWAGRKSLVRQTLGAGKCDVILGYLAGSESVATTRPYYRSTYVFVEKPGRKAAITSLLDTRLDRMRIGINMVGQDYAPPAQALARRGVQLHAFSLFGEYGEPDPAAKLIDAVQQGEVDLAIAWGPVGGYFASQLKPSLTVVPVTPAQYMGMPFTFDIVVAVRPDDIALRDELDQSLARNCAAIQDLLNDYHIPAPLEGQIPCDGSPRTPSVSSR